MTDGSECDMGIWRPEVEHVTRAQPECDMFNRGSSYFHVPLTTVRHLLNVTWSWLRCLSYRLTFNMAYTSSYKILKIVKIASSVPRILKTTWKRFLHLNFVGKQATSKAVKCCCSKALWHSYPVFCIRYDTIRDAILTCARKSTWVSLIYHT